MPNFPVPIAPVQPLQGSAPQLQVRTNPFSLPAPQPAPLATLPGNMFQGSAPGLQFGGNSGPRVYGQPQAPMFANPRPTPPLPTTTLLPNAAGYGFIPVSPPGSKMLVRPALPRMGAQKQNNRGAFMQGYYNNEPISQSA